MLQKIIFSIFFIISPFFVVAEQQELLKKSEVYRVMNEIFDQHVDKKEMTGEILENSFSLYIDQFDSKRVYFLESEINQFINLSRSDLQHVLNQYNNKKLLKYKELDRMIQDSIMRARKYREELVQKGDHLFQISRSNSKGLDLIEDDLKPPFAQTIQELKNRIKDEIVQFISLERQRYGDQVILKNKQRTLEAYLNVVNYRENQYLYQDEHGRQLSVRERENLFTMHVLKALARSLDSHTTYLNPNEAYDLKVRLEKGFQGIGVVLKRKPQGIVISRLIEGGPAKRSGKVKVGDLISKINGQDAERDTLEELVDKLRDKSYQRISLILKRTASDGTERTISVSLARELIAVDEGRVDTKFEPYGNGIIGKITLHSFYQGGNGITSEKDLRKAIKDLEKHGRLRGLILDLRENSGGFLNQAVKVAGLFITNGVVVISKYSSGEERYYRDMDGKISFDGPLIVLTSKATASAAEIVAQALQDYGVALIVGDEQTYGKGTIQSQTVTDGKSTSHFKVTVGKYYTPSGNTPQVRGVKADIVVPSYYSKELIGEEFLEYPIKSDKIPQSFKDQLSDVDPGLKPWYLRYYMPTIQKRETTWKSLISELQNSSRKRLANDPEYQRYLAGQWEWNPFADEEELPDSLDFQMKEATWILKDMIILEKSNHNVKVAEH